MQPLVFAMKLQKIRNWMVMFALVIIPILKAQRPMILKARTSISENFSVYAKFATGFAPPGALDLYSFREWGIPGIQIYWPKSLRNYELGFSRYGPVFEHHNIYAMSALFYSIRQFD